MNTKTEKEPNKKSARQGIIAIILVSVVTIGILYLRSYFADEKPLSRSYVEVDGKFLIVQFSEKTGNNSNKDPNTKIYTTGRSHFGYSLELIDSASHVSLDKYKFSSPVDPVQSEPKLCTLSNGIVWLVSEMPTISSDDNGYVLKFEIKNNKLTPIEFKLDEKYKVRELKDNKVFLSEGSDVYTSSIMVFGGVYLDLETEKVVVVPKMK